MDKILYNTISKLESTHNVGFTDEEVRKLKLEYKCNLSIFDYIMAEKPRLITPDGTALWNRKYIAEAVSKSAWRRSTTPLILKKLPKKVKA
jgi:hypothetical protein